MAKWTDTYKYKRCSKWNKLTKKCIFNFIIFGNMELYRVLWHQVRPKQQHQTLHLYVPCISIISLMDDFYWKPITDSDSRRLGEQETAIKHIKRLSIHFGDRIQSWSLFMQNITHFIIIMEIGSICDISIVRTWFTIDLNTQMFNSDGNKLIFHKVTISITLSIGWYMIKYEEVVSNMNTNVNYDF